LERYQKILISAIKQSKRALIPKVNDLISYKEFIRKNDLLPGLIGHCDCPQEASIYHVFKKQDLHKEKKATVLIGPEGDFTLEEVQLAKEIGFNEISFGRMRLKTETAGILAAHSLHLVNEILNYE
ncbi:MAG: RsmE family RNA methyltransferase, partial [Bacteroidota bacterium]